MIMTFVPSDIILETSRTYIKILFFPLNLWSTNYFLNFQHGPFFIVLYKGMTVGNNVLKVERNNLCSRPYTLEDN